MIHQGIISEEDHQNWLNSQESSHAGNRCRVAFAGGVPFGVVTLNGLDLENRHSDWGMYIGEASYRGRGLAKQLLFEILRWGFESLELHRLYTSVMADNVSALALYLKGGFEIEGLWRHHLRTSGRFRDLYWIGMLSDRWNLRREDIRTWAGARES